jgi:lysozyme
MTSIYGNYRTSKSVTGQNLEPQGRRGILNYLYVGFVKDNRDVQYMGRLRVWIPELSGDPQNESNWYTISYVSPFASASTVDYNTTNGTTYTTSQQAYGFWMIPPHLETEVLVGFIAGMPNRGVYLGSMVQQFMDQGIPGLASAPSYNNEPDGTYPPVVEYNKKIPTIQPPNGPLRPRFDPLANALESQGLFVDTYRGPTDASARRESPSNVYGLITPQGNHFYIDDGALTPNTFSTTPAGATAEKDLRQRTVAGANQYIRMRTRNGVQLLLNDTEGYIYMITAQGNSWAEISDQGINFYTNQDIRMRGINIHMRADQNMNLDVVGNLNVNVGGTVNWNVGGDFNKLVSGNENKQVLGDYHMQAGGQIFRDAPRINDNSGATQNVTPLPTNQVVDYAVGGGKTTTQTILPANAFLTHESWSYHLKGGNLTFGSNVPDTPSQNAQSSFSPGAAFAGAVKPNDVVGQPKSNLPRGVYKGTGYQNGQPQWQYTGSDSGLTKPASELTLSSQGLDLIKQFEGTHIVNGLHTEYNDAGHPAIGYGHDLTPSEISSGNVIINGQPVPYAQGLTQDQANGLLQQDTATAQAAVQSKVTQPLTQNQFDALTSFTYNVGTGGFAQSSVLRDVNSGNNGNVPSDLGLWVNSGGQVNQGLVNRRTTEGLVFSQTPTAA